MLKKYPVIKCSFVGLLSLVVAVIAFGFWFMSLIPSDDQRSHLPSTLPKDLPYVTQSYQTSKGKILAIVTSHDTMGNSGKKTGYELTELSRPYYVFQANGFEIDIASPNGGEPPVIIDKDDMGAFDYAFLNDSVAQHKVVNSIPVDRVNAEDYVAVYFAGGKGAMFDFPENSKIQSLVRQFNEANKVIGAVCHGPAALVNATHADGTAFLSNRQVCGFTNTEELFLIPDARTVFPFLLQDQLKAQGASFKEGHMYMKNVVRDGNLVTGQNPWSTWAFAEAMVQQLGHEPKARKHTAEENTIEILNAYQANGYDSAIAKINDTLNENRSIDPMLLGMHCIVAGLQLKVGETIDKIRLLAYADGQLSQ